MATEGDTYQIGDEKDLYQKHEKIRPKKVSGFFNNLRVTSVWLLLGFYYLGPWLTWNGRQAILLDLPARKFHLFGITFWPQDFIFLSLLLVIAALALFFFTSVAGRLWCGYACPQTVWTQLFVWVERRVEGDRNKQVKLSNQAWNWNKFRIKFTKHFLWIILALFTGYTFVGYFVPIKTLTQEILTLSTGPWETFWVLFYSFATWGNAGKLREQVCIYMCPYARFQSAMFDKDTLIIAYDEKRGESRGARKKGDESYQEQGLGDCIDCMQCVHVCPTGIDIRDGLQYECIACAACIDVCDSVMEKMDYPKGLIRYTTENKEQGKAIKLLRFKTIGYGLVLLLLSGVFIGSLLMRTPLELDINKDRNRLYITNSEGLIENVYKLEVLNKSQQQKSYQISVQGPEQLLYKGPAQVTVAAGDVKELPIRLSIDPVYMDKSNIEVMIHLEATDDPSIAITEPARFLGPALTLRR
ncbi:cytochrome c oxidase accessory protein CcoG [Kangiella sp. TOML190]|uniref:cytochrome c oxidase accessory protein CcoG n=1 Tax=Kangiella sp. TOML190 TaxID=2931351 RepID=UPI00203F40D8|nr:cytochrome c oxidase accessory protein CcoG [Kangiella sp. TOML190]